MNESDIVKKVLFSGSRKCTNLMAQRAQKAVKNIADSIEKGEKIQVVVGDAYGIDAIIVRHCMIFDVPIVCYGANEQCRLTYFDHVIPYVFARDPDLDKWHSMERREHFLYRDRVIADIADEGIFIWNGESSGTIYTFKYMKSLPGKAEKCWLITFDPNGKEIVRRGDK